MICLSQTENRDESFDTEVKSNHNNANGVEDKFKNATELCQEIDQNVETLSQDESHVQNKIEENHINGNGVEDKSENRVVESLITQTSALELCQEIVNPNDQNVETLFQDDLKIKERSPSSISDESEVEEIYRIGVDSTTITFTSLDNEEQGETGPQVNYL